MELFLEFHKIQMLYLEVLESRLVCVKSFKDVFSAFLKWFVYVIPKIDGVQMVQVELHLEIREFYTTLVNPIRCGLVDLCDLILHIVDFSVKFKT